MPLVVEVAPIGHANPAAARGKTLFWVLALVAWALYVAECAHTPISLRTYQIYDDGLFIRLAESLAHGDWLGPFTFTTLIKGPGYPAFIAASSWLGLSLSVAQALFIGGSVVAAGRLILALSGSCILASLTTVLVLFHPDADYLWVLRGGVYAGQMVLVVFLTAASFYLPHGAARRAAFGIAAGLVFGWFWLTREEGVALLPGLGVLLLCAVLRARIVAGAPSIRQIGVSAGWIAAAFALVLVGFGLGNRIAYGRFIGVDVKQADFQSAMQALQSVHAGPSIDYVPVSRQARAAIYAVSPAFAELRDGLDPPGGSVWANGGCRFHAETCGDIDGAFFWAVRDAAAAHGYYKSPTEAASYFKRLAREVNAACRAGRLICRRSLLPMLPHISARQLRGIPDEIDKAFAFLTMRDPPALVAPPSEGEQADIQRALSFLNFPEIQPTAQPGSGATPPDTRLDIWGWYYKSGTAWFTAAPLSSTDGAMRLQVDRYASPDLIAAHPGAGDQRFHISVECQGGCGARLAADGATMTVRGDHPPPAGQVRPLGGGSIAFDRIAVSTPKPASDLRQDIARRVRGMLIPIYAALSPTLIVASLISAAVVLVRDWRAFVRVPLLSVSLACWIIVLCRLALLILVDISSFVGLYRPYAVSAILLSYFASLTLGGGAILIVRERNAAGLPHRAMRASIT